MSGYDAANYSFYEGSDYSFYGDAPQIILAAIAQPLPGEDDLHIEALVGADPGALVPHTASRSIAWRARMTQARFDGVRKALNECRIPLVAARTVAARPSVQKIALFVTRQEESPKAVLDWCRANPDKARVCGMFSTNASLEPLAASEIR